MCYNHTCIGGIRMGPNILDKLTLDRKLVRELDIKTLLAIIAIVLFGTLNIYSATYLKSGTHYLKAQLLWLVVGLVVTYVILCFDYSVLENYATILYWASILLLVINDTIFKNSVVNGAASWIRIGSVGIQPSEFAKLAMIIMLSKKLSDMNLEINNPKNFLTLAGYAALPMALIVIQPDMGMTMVCFFIVLGIFFVAGLDLKVIGGGFAGVAALIALIWNLSIMPTYWKNRLVSFINPEADELGSGLQLLQSQIGIGSGEMFGKGFMKGTQVSGGFIPEAHTDFIFSVVGEEWGFIGAMILVIVYGYIIYRFIIVARTSKDIFGSMLTVGIVSSLLFSLLQNIGMTIGLMPITGITLPFMSYGGSSMLTNFMAVAIVLNIGMRRKKINF
ncbi:MAG: rodA [Firmicutes bacterium]|nr:rodA [Bacillota bacterium]